MIRRVLAFFLLVAVGLIALRLATGDAGFTGDRTAEQAAPEKTTDEPAGIEIGTSDESSDLPQGLSVQIGGKMSIPRTRTVQIGNRTRELQVYLLKCEDSVPIGDDRLQMLGLTVDFFEVGGTPDDPREVRVATLTADEAFAQLGVDEQGRTSVEEDKEMRVIRAVIETTEDASIKNLTLVLDEALALSTDDGIRVHTPDSTQRFEMKVEGEEPWRITGEGLDAWLPRRSGGPGDDIRIDVLHRPNLFQSTVDGTTTLRARGTLSYRENTADGRTIIRMEDEVEISMAGGTLGGDRIEGSGESLRAQLTRHKSRLSGSSPDSGSRSTHWQRIWLQGEPVTLTGSGAELLCAELEIVPGPGGQPYLFSAVGSPASMTHVDERGITTTTRADRRIHVLRPGDHQAAVFGAFGFPVAVLGPLNRYEFVILEGAAVVDRDGEWELKASEGLWLMRSLPADDGMGLHSEAASSGEPQAMRGFGEVEILQRGEGEELSLQGNMGFAIAQHGGVRSIRLGPETLAPEHRYTVRRGALQLDGVGSCAMIESPDRITVKLRAPGPQINARLGDGEGSLLDVVDLDAAIDGGRLESFVASGPVCRILWGAEGEFDATAQRVESLDPDSFRLSGTVTAPAHAWYRPAETVAEAGTVQARNVEVFGTEIRIFRLSGQHAVIEADAPEPSVARVRLDATRGAELPTQVDLRARRIRFLPFGVDPAALPTHALPAGIRDLFALSMRSPYLLAREQVRVVQEEPPTSQRANGDFLLLSLGARAGYLTGEPASLERRDADGQTINGIASRVEMRSESEGELLWLVATPDRLPELELIDPTGSLNETSGEPSRMKVSSEGDIRVYPDAVRFLGAVKIRSVLLDGSEDPKGLHMVADTVTMARDAESGEILDVQAAGNVRLDWSKIRATGHSLTLDPKAGLITVSDPDRKAMVQMPSGPRYTAAMVRANYRTYRVTSWYSRVDGGGRGK